MSNDLQQVLIEENGYLRKYIQRLVKEKQELEARNEHLEELLESYERLYDFDDEEY